MRLIFFILASCALPGRSAAGDFCGVWLDKVSHAAARQGDTVELRGSWGEARGKKTPSLNNNGSVQMAVTSWSTHTVRAIVPWTIAPGKYKIGVYCDFYGPDRKYTSDWVDFEVLDKDAPRPETPAAAEPPAAAAKPAPPPGPMPDLRVWLWNHPKLYEHISWGRYDYRQWDESKTASLERYFKLAWEGKPMGLPDPPADIRPPDQRRGAWSLLAEKDALDLYLATVAQSLAAEADRRVPWSLEDYTTEQRALLLSPKEMFVNAGNGFRIPQERTGTVLPPPPDAGWEFMRGRLGPDRRSTIVALLQWAADNLIHFEGAVSNDNMVLQWQYSGLPPVTRMLAGTPYTGKPERRIKHRTAGCGGTAGFLRSLLRSVNIPVQVVYACNHSQVYFPSEKLYLGHGDDPYNTELDAKGCGAARLLLDEAEYNSWFKNPLKTDCRAILDNYKDEVLKKPCEPR